MSKNGFSYYKAETDRFQDIKIKRLKKKYGCDGYAVYQYALNEIYRVEGAYIRWTEDQLFDCADYWDMNEARVKEIIGYCAEVCLFDPVMWKTQCILTSRAIQSRYLDICKISKKKSYIPLEILLVEPEQPMREPVAMPLFEGGAGAAEHDTPNQATLAEQKFRSTPEFLFGQCCLIRCIVFRRPGPAFEEWHRYRFPHRLFRFYKQDFERYV